MRKTLTIPCPPRLNNLVTYFIVGLEQMSANAGVNLFSEILNCFPVEITSINSLLEYINDLVMKINAVGLGVNCGDVNISVLAYADDLVLIAENEEDFNTLSAVLGVHPIPCV